MTEKARIDKLLVDRQLAETRTKAQALIMAGEVLVNGKAVTKAGETVPVLSEIQIRDRNPYVSRGGLKLAAALDGFKVSPDGKVCMDVGASTGGFTDCLLQAGAKKVFAIDVGHNQLHEKLKTDPRVINMEGLNYRYFSCESLKEKVEFVTIDVSFISLDKILPVVINCVTETADILAMVKPQFEATPRELKKGVVRDETVRNATIKKIKSVADSLGLDVLGGMDSPVKGPQGNVEHFLWLKRRKEGAL
jgi:23S rRNA (cytidine1920-2'-O)/16S rRNA (cytidine1409-2'-O)-methyltransferase